MLVLEISHFVFLLHNEAENIKRTLTIEYEATSPKRERLPSFERG